MLSNTISPCALFSTEKSLVIVALPQRTAVGNDRLALTLLAQPLATPLVKATASVLLGSPETDLATLNSLRSVIWKSFDSSSGREVAGLTCLM
jgi:hypothetical protein